MTTPDPTPSMFRRPLGKTGLMVSEVGYGAWGIGGTQWVGADDQESTRALQRYIDLGDHRLPIERLRLPRHTGG